MILIILFAVWYYRLGVEFNKQGWVYALIGAGIFFVSQVIAGVFAAILGLTGTGELTIIALVVSVGITALSYNLIRKSLRNNPGNAKGNDELLD